MGADPLYSFLNPTCASEELSSDFHLINQIGVLAKNSSSVYPEGPSPSEDLKPCLPVLSIANTIPYAHQRTHTAPNYHNIHGTLKIMNAI